ncbi:MAG: hypothetical protein FWG75_01225 [Cystobacterineae bacterium]|nr:hypothetical protein [Cystobacterineae bacterium]
MKAFALGTLCIVALGAASACSSADSTQESISPQPSYSPRLSVEMPAEAARLTPVVAGEYSERSTTVAVVVSGFISSADAEGVELSTTPVSGLQLAIETPPASENAKTFHLTVNYDGSTAFPEGFAKIHLQLTQVPEGYAYNAEPQTLYLAIADGQAKTRPIPLSQANVEAFNVFANTETGLALHYRLTENIRLAEPAWLTTSNWTPIGIASTFPSPVLSPFVGSFDGGGHTLFGLRVMNIGNQQGLFGYIEGATIENLGLVDVRVVGNYAGSLVGQNAFGTVRNCHAAGDVGGSMHTGGLVGENSGTVHSSYFAGNVNSLASGGGTSVGGLVGLNQGTVHSSHTSGSATGSYAAGGLVGINQGAIENSYAMGNATVPLFYAHAGGLVGENSGTVHSSYATGNATGVTRDEILFSYSGTAGGLVGANLGTVHSSYATGNATGNNHTGGLAGTNQGTIENTYATGYVSGGGTYMGGLVGLNQGPVENSYATGSVAGKYPGAVDEYYPYVSYAVGGLVGENRNAGTLHNCMALNLNVIGATLNTNVGRIVGTNNNALSNNHAFSGMQSNAGNTTWPNPGLAHNNGADIHADALQTANGFPDAFSTTPWTYVEGRLPGLLGETVAMPVYLQTTIYLP